jgi:hypothetical protein
MRAVLPVPGDGQRHVPFAKAVRALLPITSLEERCVEEGRLLLERSYRIKNASMSALIELRMPNLNQASLADVTMG